MILIFISPPGSQLNRHLVRVLLDKLYNHVELKLLSDEKN
jgi:hypothetical protein